MYSLLGRKILLTINLRQKDLSTPLWAARVVSALEDFHSTWAGTHFAHSADLLMKSVIALVWISWADFKILDGNFSELSTSLEASAFTLVKISEALDSLLNFSSICMYLKIIKLNLFWKYFPIQKNFQCIASWLRLFYASILEVSGIESSAFMSMGQRTKFLYASSTLRVRPSLVWQSVLDSILSLQQEQIRVVLIVVN